MSKTKLSGPFPELYAAACAAAERRSRRPEEALTSTVATELLRECGWFDRLFALTPLHPKTHSPRQYEMVARVLLYGLDPASHPVGLPELPSECASGQPDVEWFCAGTIAHEAREKLAREWAIKAVEDYANQSDEAATP